MTSSTSNGRVRGPKLSLKNGGLTVGVSLHRTETKDLIQKRNIERRTPDGSRLLKKKQRIEDDQGNVITEAKVKKYWMDDDGDTYENGDVVEMEDGEEAEPYSKTDIVDLRRLESPEGDFLYTDYYEASPDSDTDTQRLWEMAKDIRDNGPLYGPVVFRKGYKRDIAVVTAEIDEDKGKFSVLVRLTNSRIRLTQPQDIPTTDDSSVPKL
jgi:hypothetical protein